MLAVQCRVTHAVSPLNSQRVGLVHTCCWRLGRMFVRRHDATMITTPRILADVLWRFLATLLLSSTDPCIMLYSFARSINKFTSLSPVDVIFFTIKWVVLWVRVRRVVCSIVHCISVAISCSQLPAVAGSFTPKVRDATVCTTGSNSFWNVQNPATGRKTDQIRRTPVA